MQPWNTVISEGEEYRIQQSKEWERGMPKPGNLERIERFLKGVGPAVQASGTTKSECVETAIVKKLGGKF